MSRFIKKAWPSRDDLEIESLLRGKKLSTKAKIQWLQDALEFAMASKKNGTKKIKKIAHGKN